jgi:N-acetylmuramic acid 6-phosphate (MurNAc-6-P) etherase
MLKSKLSAKQAEDALKKANGNLRDALRLPATSGPI